MSRRDRQPGRWQWLCDGRELLAAIGLHDDGWRVLMRGREHVGTFPTREMALAMANARIAGAPGAPVAGERERDAKHVNRIRVHQRQAETRWRKKTPRGGRSDGLTARQSGVSGQPHGGRKGQ